MTQTTQTKRIESYGLYDFCQDLQEAFKEGYDFDFETNENFPTAYGTMLTCGLVKAGEKVEETETETEVETEKVEKVEKTASVTSVVEEVAQVAESDASNDQEVAETVAEVEATETEVENLTEQQPADTPAKRGPKPKNK